MSHIALRAAAALSALGTMALPTPLRAEEPRIVIRMYDVAMAGPAMREEAMRTSASIVQDAGVKVEWVDCSRGGAHHPCRAVPGARELVVRLMPPETQSAGSRDALSVRGPAGAADEQLGFAALGRGAQSGILATVYYDAVQAVAKRSGIKASTLLGRAIAHEVGHLVMPTGGHSATGLMRAVWAETELTDNRREDWVFSPLDSRQLRGAASLR